MVESNPHKGVWCKKALTRNYKGKVVNRMWFTANGKLHIEFTDKTYFEGDAKSFTSGTN